jgi:hypothetical protein
MSLLRCLLAVALVCGLSGVARASQADFHTTVLDPFATTPIFTTPFQFSFDPCVAGQLPTNVKDTYAGCFSAVNRTGKDWIGLQLVFGNTDSLGGQPASCALDGSADLFKNTSCALTPDGSKYILSFTGGAIPNNGSFVIAEDGVAPADFPMIDASVTTVTPEPDSILLLSTGIAALGSLAAKRRRWSFRASRG